MYSVVVTVEIDPAAGERARAELEQRIVPLVKQAPGLVAGYWLDPDDPGGGQPLTGWSLVVAESREAAEAMADMARAGQTPEGVRITGATVREVIAHT